MDEGEDDIGEMIMAFKTRQAIRIFIDKLSKEQCREISKKLKGDENMEIDQDFDKDKRLDLFKEISERKVDLKESKNFTERFNIYMDGICEEADLLEEIIRQVNQYSPDFFDPMESQERKEAPKSDEQRDQSEQDTPKTYPKTYPLLTYEMRRIPRGTCIIINNTFKHDAELYRKGTDCDRDRLKRLFEWLDFEVKLKDDMTADKIHEMFNNLEDEILEDSDCFVCCILTHGGPSVLYGNDTTMKKAKPVPRKILREAVLANYKCKKLANKPKLFFVQACRKDLNKEGSGDVTPAYRDARERAPASDICIVAATTEDTFAYRNGSGSLFIQSLCQVFEAFAHKEPFYRMMLRVKNELSNEEIYVTNKHTQKSERDFQIPDFTMGTLCGELYFNPGKSFEDYCTEENIDRLYFDCPQFERQNERSTKCNE